MPLPFGDGLSPQAPQLLFTLSSTSLLLLTGESAFVIYSTQNFWLHVFGNLYAILNGFGQLESKDGSLGRIKVSMQEADNHRYNRTQWRPWILVEC